MEQLHVLRSILVESLFDDGAGGVTLVPASWRQNESDQSDVGVFPLSDVALPNSCKIKKLPKLNGQFLCRLEEMVRDLDSGRVLVMPPLRKFRFMKEEVRTQFQGRRISAEIYCTVLSSLDNGNRAGAFISPSDLAHPLGRSLREQIMIEAAVNLIARLGQSDLFSDLVVKPQFIVSTVGSDRDSVSTSFFRVPDEVTSETPIVEDFKEAFNRPEGQTEHGFILDRALSPDEPWSYEALNPDLEDKLDFIRDLGETKDLSKLFEVRPGVRRSSVENFSDLDFDSDKAGSRLRQRDLIPVVGPFNIQKDGSIETSFLRRWIPRSEIKDDIDQLRLRSGNICVPHITSSEGLRVGIVEDDREMVADDGLIILRPRSGVGEVDRLVVAQYLQSDIAQSYLRAYSTNRGSPFRLDVSTLRDLPVPDVDEDLRRAISQLNDAAEEFGKWKQEAEEDAQSLFDSPTAHDSRMYMMQVGRKTKQRQAEAERIDKLTYRIQTRYPYPIAYRWRTIESSEPDLEGYIDILECAEATLSYVGLVGLMLSQKLDGEIGHAKNIAGKIDSKNGTTFYDWKSVVKQLNHNFDVPEDSPLYEFGHFWDEESDELGEIVDKLRHHRNENSHLQGPRGIEVGPDYEEVKSRLRFLLGKVEFIADYPLRFIEHVRADTFRGKVEYDHRDLEGAHPLVPRDTKEIEMPSSDVDYLEEKSLYLVDRSGEMHLMRPYLLWERCPECNRWTTFTPNCRADEGGFELQSLDHQHTTVRADKDGALEEALRQVDLLSSDTEN